MAHWDAISLTQRERSPQLIDLPAEVLLHVYSFLDLPDLTHLGSLSPILCRLSLDRALHRVRVLVVAPSRVEHALFALGGTLRPTVADLCQWNVLRGLGIERRWRNGLYFNSPQSVIQYETSLRLQRNYVRRLLTTHLRTRPTTPARSVHVARILPDAESVSPHVSRSLIPILRKLKWSFKRDKLAKEVRRDGTPTPIEWLEGHGHGLLQDVERVRLAICPGVGKVVKFYETLSKKS